MCPVSCTLRFWSTNDYSADLALQAFASGAQQQAEADAAPFATSIDNYYQTDAISRASSTMAKCTLAKANSAHAAQ
jgi:NADH-ubiquinone oxidoreductase subunit G, C-terminal